MNGGIIIYKFVGCNLKILVARYRSLFIDIGRCSTENNDIEQLLRNIKETLKRDFGELVIDYDRLDNSEVIDIPNFPHKIFLMRETCEEIIIGDDSGKLIWISLDTFLSKKIMKFKLDKILRSQILFDELKRIERKIETHKLF
jgi:hypothetical protein